MSMPFVSPVNYARPKENRPHRFAYDFGSVDPGMFTPTPERSLPKRAPKRTVSYTIPLPDDDDDNNDNDNSALQLSKETNADEGRLHKGHPQGHVLGVNALALSFHAPATDSQATSVGGVLFSGGRDGVVKAWDLGFPLRYTAANVAVIASTEGSGGQSDSAVSAGTRSWAVDRHKARRKRPQTCLRASRLVHSDWVNDLVVVNGGQTVVSASSDQTVRAWSFGKPDERPVTVGSHLDYVKALAYSDHRSMVISGGLDRKIKLWDIGQPRPSAGPIACLQEFGDASLSSSVYALSCNAQGSLVVSGSPEKLVRVWDTRAGRQLTTLSGHTDHIRAVLLSSDSELVLTGSSDTTVKLWSMRMRRCLSTFAQHSDSVWSLHSSHPRFQTFYSASRDGLVTKTVGAGLFADEHHSVRRPSIDDSAHTGAGGGGSGSSQGVVCVAVAREPQGVVKIVAADDTYIWTATKGATLNRWLDVSVRSPSRLTAEHEPLHASQPVVATVANGQGSSDSDGEDKATERVLQRSLIEPLLSLSIPKLESHSSQHNHHHHHRSLTADLDPEIISIPESPLPPGAFLRANTITSAATSPTAAPQAQPFSPSSSTNLATSLGDKVVPVRSKPDETIYGKHGLHRHRFLNNRRQVLAQDTQGLVSLWDIMLCKRVHVFPETASEAANSVLYPGVYGKDMDAICMAVSGEPESVNPWCHVDTRVGALTVHLDESQVWSAEVHVDEVDGVTEDTMQAMGDHERVNIGQWMLKRLFLAYARNRVKRGPISRKEATLLNRWASQIPTGAIVSARSSALNIQQQQQQQKEQPTGHSPAIASQLRNTLSEIGIDDSVLMPKPSSPLVEVKRASTYSVDDGDTDNADPSPSNTSGSSPGAGTRPSPHAPHHPRHQHNPSIDAMPNTALPNTQPADQQQNASKKNDDGEPGSGSGSAGKFMNRLLSMRVRRQKSSSLSTTNGAAAPAAPVPPVNNRTVSTPNNVAGNETERRPTPPPKQPQPQPQSQQPLQQLPKVPEKDEFAEWAGPRYPTDTERTLALLQAQPAPWEQLYSPVICPRLPLPRNVVIQIYQNHRDASEPYAIYRSTVTTIAAATPVPDDDISMSAFRVTDDPLLSLEMCMPSWLTDFLLFNRLPASYQEPTKVSFVLSPLPTATLPPFPNPNARLVANRMLRARKLAVYVVDKLGLPLMQQPAPNYINAVESCLRSYSLLKPAFVADVETSGNSYIDTFVQAGETLSAVERDALEDMQRFRAIGGGGNGDSSSSSTETNEQKEYVGRPDLYLDLFCKGQKVHSRSTLATIKAHVWKSSGDIQVHYDWAEFIKKRVAMAQSLAQKLQA
ncbi:hypothetical protein H4R99_002007 [Coemansia sp. RSA 1722]|nr:hypothetical protein IWW45_007893 [Coemansia sp. RSA 485]KAJ2604138.1 hypothetical protein H4R99_002007 [Coemansia sp. RSA 1722]